MKGIVLTVCLALVFGIVAVSCDNGVAPDDYGDKELLVKYARPTDHPGSIFDTDNNNLGGIFEGNNSAFQK